MTTAARAGWALINKLFVCRDVLKLGVDFHSDLKKLAADYRHCAPGPGQQVLGGLALFCDVQAQLSVGAKRESLAKIVQRRLGIELSKEQQKSDWGRRPLSQEQLEYAALDAWVLLPLFDTLSPQEFASLETRSLDCRKPRSATPPRASAPTPGQQQRVQLHTVQGAPERATENGGAAQKCAECGRKTAEGDIDAGDGKFYCEGCFRKFDYLEEVAEMVRRQGQGSKLSLSGDQP